MAGRGKNGGKIKENEPNIAEWLLRDGIIGSLRLSESDAAKHFGLSPSQFDLARARVTRQLLAKHGFSDPDGKPGAPISQAEALGWQMVKSLEANSRAAADVEFAMSRLREDPDADPTTVKDMSAAIVRLNRQRDQLTTKLSQEARQLAKMARDDAREEGGGSVTVVVHAGELDESWLHPAERVTDG